MAFAWPELAVSVAVGTVAGGITNAIAVWMLFHPYDTRFGLQGAIPKNKARLAKSIGRTVGEKLLTPADLVHELERSGMRDAVESKLADIVRDLLDHERGALTAELPPTVLAEVERVLAGLSALLAEAYAREVHDEAFAAKVRDFVARARTQVDGIPLSQLLTPERQERLAQQAALLSTEIIASSRQDDGRTLRAKLGDYLLKIAGTERTERFVERTVRDALGRSEERTVGDLLGTLPDETYVDWILAAARSPRAAELAFGTAGKAARRLLDTPIGRPARYLPPDAAERLAAAAGPALWQWAMGRVPDLLGRLDIEAMVERKVLGFSTERLEQIVRQVTDRELKLIVRLGYVLGAAIGALSYLTRSLLPG